MEIAKVDHRIVSKLSDARAILMDLIISVKEPGNGGKG